MLGEIKALAIQIVNKVLDRDIVWTDFQKMPEEARRTWGDQARAALDNPVLQSLIGRSSVIHGQATSGEVAKRFMENVARFSKDHHETENLRMVLCGVELVRELLEESLYSKDAPTVEDVNAAI